MRHVCTAMIICVTWQRSFMGVLRYQDQGLYVPTHRATTKSKTHYEGAGCAVVSVKENDFDDDYQNHWSLHQRSFHRLLLTVVSGHNAM